MPESMSIKQFQQLVKDWDREAFLKEAKKLKKKKEKT
jgi:hypothetical protein